MADWPIRERALIWLLNTKNIYKNISRQKSAEKKRIFILGRKNNIIVKKRGYTHIGIEKCRWFSKPRSIWFHNVILHTTKQFHEKKTSFSETNIPLFKCAPLHVSPAFFYMMSLKIKLQSFWSSWDLNFLVYKSSWSPAPIRVGCRENQECLFIMSLRFVIQQYEGVLKLQELSQLL